MSLADIASLSTAISGVAVTLSLLYLALQVHQNTKHTRALIHQGRIARIAELAIASADADMATIIVGGMGGSATPEDVRRFRFTCWCAASFYGWQDSFAQHRKGLLEEDVFKQMRSAVAVAFALAAPGARAEWETRIRVPGTEFAAFVDEIASTLPKPVA